MPRIPVAPIGPDPRRTPLLTVISRFGPCHGFFAAATSRLSRQWSDGSGWGIDAALRCGRVLLGSEFRVNTFTTNSQSPQHAMDDSGNFIVWLVLTVIAAASLRVMMCRNTAGRVRVIGYRQQSVKSPSIAMDGSGLRHRVAEQWSGRQRLGIYAATMRRSASGQRIPR